jgi:hypothetical protein
LTVDLKHYLVYAITGEVGALLPVVATLLQFSPEEVNAHLLSIKLISIVDDCILS